MVPTAAIIVGAWRCMGLHVAGRGSRPVVGSRGCGQPRLPMKRSTILVTGGCGFIGSAFVRQRVDRGDTVIVLDAMTYAGHEENLEGITGPGAVELVRGDIGDGALVSALFERHRFDAVINFAAESHVDRSITSPSAFIDTNIRGVFVLLTASLDHARRHAAFRFVQISTDEVYGSLGPEGRFSETTPM